MMRILPTAAIVAALVTAAPALAATSSQLKSGVERNLQRLSIDVDVDTLSTGQIAALHTILTGKRTQSDKRGLAKSVIGGTHSLRGILFDTR
ncbi:MAG: hypothetical protein KJO78_15975 [Alphaproteobacteria bacterium]|nr:hypothetical protein [Alphaproteobacteria bacterium]